MRYLILALILTATSAAYAYGPNGPDSVVDARSATSSIAGYNFYNGPSGVLLTTCGVVPGSQSSSGLELDCMSISDASENLLCKFGHWGSGADGRSPDWCDMVDDADAQYFTQVVSADTRITFVDLRLLFTNLTSVYATPAEIFWNYEASDGTLFWVRCDLFYGSGSYVCETGPGSLR